MIRGFDDRSAALTKDHSDVRPSHQPVAAALLAVEDCRHNLDDLFASAQAAEDAGDIAEAERLYRILMKTDPTDASAAFNLGNMLRAHGQNVEAGAALRAATRIDPAFAEAWHNLGDLLDRSLLAMAQAAGVAERRAHQRCVRREFPGNAAEAAMW